METMKNIFGLHQPTRLEARQLDDQNTQLTEKSLIGALQSFFTENVNSLITATLIYFTLFAGFTRMKNKHLALAVPCAAIWTVHQAGALLLPLGGAAAVVAAAKAYFAWQGISASEVAKEVIRDGASTLAGTATTLGQDQLLGNTAGKGTPSAEHRQGMQAVFEQMQEQRTAPVPTATTTIPTLAKTPETDVFDEALREYEGLERTDRSLPLETTQEFEAIWNQPPSTPETQRELEAVWNQPPSIQPSDDLVSEFLKQNPDARETFSSLTKEQVKSFEEIWGMVQSKQPGATMNDSWVQEFMSEQCMKKGLPWGKLAKFAGILFGVFAVGYVFYKFNPFVTTPAAEEKKEKTRAVEPAPKPTAETTKKKKQALAMHLLFGQSNVAKAFQDALKKRVEDNKAKVAPQQMEASHAAASDEQRMQQASRRLGTVMRHTASPVEDSRTEETPHTSVSDAQRMEKTSRRLANIALMSGRCGTPFAQTGTTLPLVAKL
ncbi:MAG: hypothetical protein H7A38_07155 [Chlamydiales bacterium]|nr:hypothetical protein [Chlamydiales bacterium]